jgi:hypothetical protein
MAAGTWNIFKNAKRQVGRGAIALQTRASRISLHSIGASAALSANNDITSLASIGSELAGVRGYAANGKTISAAAFTLSATNGVYSGCAVFWSANGGNLGSGTIKYAVLHFSYAAGTRFPFAYVTLSGTPFLVGDGSRLTVNNGGAKYFEIQ